MTEENENSFCIKSANIFWRFPSPLALLGKSNIRKLLSQLFEIDNQKIDDPCVILLRLQHYKYYNPT